MENIRPICSLCTQPPNQGLYDGFRLVGVFICSTCEKGLIATEIGSLSYQQALNQLKDLLYPNAFCKKECW